MADELFFEYPGLVRKTAHRSNSSKSPMATLLIRRMTWPPHLIEACKNGASTDRSSAPSQSPELATYRSIAISQTPENHGLSVLVSWHARHHGSQRSADKA